MINEAATAWARCAPSGTPNCCPTFRSPTSAPPTSLAPRAGGSRGTTCSAPPKRPYHRGSRSTNSCRNGCGGRAAGLGEPSGMPLNCEPRNRPRRQRAAPPSSAALFLPLHLGDRPGAGHCEEQLQCQEGVAPGGVREAATLKPVLARQTVQGPVRELVPQLVAPWAEARERHVETSKVLRELLSGEHPHEVAEVVGAGESHPPWRSRVPTDEFGRSQPLPELIGLDPFRRMTRKVDAGGAEEGHRLRRVQVHVHVEAEVERPHAPQSPAVARHRDP
eukprot:CAMPEP_0176285704 /NCGR_PEP_ID=MMETSP0121_2-20121125/52511_1 /TAXON_ID=160619 /ORGANISM="Kryptoperidinium foliaceum, Strain CCMP 1326" /LENGTH=276 /DNA_ID=CAMNT_0017626205 /DNA_START=191 /DNA_END=1019 /DNA_ORIENTATION=+